MAPLVLESYTAMSPAMIAGTVSTGPVLVRKQRLLRVELSPNHTSEMQVHG